MSMPQDLVMCEEVGGQRMTIFQSPELLLLNGE